MTRTMLDFAESCQRFPEELQKAQARGVRRAALHVTRSVRGEIRAATNGDMEMSGVGLRGARVGARYDIKGTVNPTALIRATGPLHLIERDTRPHEIKRRKRRGKKALRMADGRFVSGAVQHPGTRGKRPFAKGVDATKESAPRVFDAEIQRAMREVFT